MAAADRDEVDGSRMENQNSKLKETKKVYGAEFLSA